MTNQAQVVIRSKNLHDDMAFFGKIGFLLDQIYPSDNPEVAIISGYDLQIRLDKNCDTPPPAIHILTDSPELINDGKTEFKSPGGTIIKVLPKTHQLQIPETKHKFEVRKLSGNDSWVIGRAGMLYRDLIPDRLGGSIIASHIHIPKGGPVPDMVHYHTIGFQLIFCYNGWVKLVYEDQGEPFILNAGDCVTQPPEIRHRVLEASDNLQVIEIGVPACHMTTIDHEMELPTKSYDPERKFYGQQFCHHKKEEAQWHPWRMDGFQFRDTGINKASNGVAAVIVAQPLNSGIQTQATSHRADILFTFVMHGKMKLNTDGYPVKDLVKGDAFVIPPGLKYRFTECSNDLELLEVTLPGS